MIVSRFTARLLTMSMLLVVVTAVHGEVTKLGVPYASEPRQATLLSKSGGLALFAGETEEDTSFNATNKTGECRNSLFARKRANKGKDEWRLVMTSGGDWKDAERMDEWCRDRAGDARHCFDVLKAALATNGRHIWLVCNPHTGTYNIVGCLDLARNTFRVLVDGDSAEEQPDGTILVKNKKTYMDDENGESLGAAWYDQWITPDGKVVRKSLPSRLEDEHELDEDTEKLKREFETEWMRHVAGYTNDTTAGMSDDYWDMQDFIKEWKPRILRNQVYKEKDVKVRLEMVEWMVKEDTIDGLYHGMLIPHQELMDRRAAYEAIANLPATIDGVDLQFKNGRATWMSREYEDCEMTAMMKPNFVWVRNGAAYVFVATDISENFKGGMGSDALLDYWLLRFSGKRCVSVHKLPYKDVVWSPCLSEAPFGRKYTLGFFGGKACVMNCISGKVVFSVKE